MIADSQAHASDAAMARAEMAKRALAARRLIDFCQYVDPDAAREYGAAHLRLIAATIERAIDGTLWEGMRGSGKKVLFITTPPNHWKSSLISRKLPAWYVGHRQAAGLSHQVILTSYNATLAQANNAQVLELMQTPRYSNVFPKAELSRKMRSSEKWSLADDAFTTCVATGIEGGLTGNHASLLIVDDPIKDRQQANSRTWLATLWNFWIDVARARLTGDDAFILGVWTRWSVDDPIGRLMAAQAAGEIDERIYMLRLPALAETPAQRVSVGKLGLPVDAHDPLGREAGQALWPERESAAAHRATKKGWPLTFASLYQGRPQPTGGYLIGADKFKPLAMLPTKRVRWVWATDFALTEKQTAPKTKDPDYTVLGLIGLWQPAADDVRLVIGYVQRAQLDPSAAWRMVADGVLAVPKKYPIYSGQANVDRTFLSNLQDDPRLAGYRIRNLKRAEFKGDKVTKASPWIEMAHAGKVYVMQGAWNSDLYVEVEAFPRGAHDDIVDMISVGAAALGIGALQRKASSRRVPNFGG